jgi:hypothetical protein
MLIDDARTDHRVLGAVHNQHRLTESPLKLMPNPGGSQRERLVTHVREPAPLYPVAVLGEPTGQ